MRTKAVGAARCRDAKDGARHPGKHPLTLGLLPPATLRLLTQSLTDLQVRHKLRPGVNMKATNAESSSAHTI